MTRSVVLIFVVGFFEDPDIVIGKMSNIGGLNQELRGLKGGEFLELADKSR